MGAQTIGEQVDRGFDSDETSESGRAPSDYTESSDDDGGAILSDADAIMQDDSDRDDGQLFCGESDAASIGESVGSDCDSSLSLSDDEHGSDSDDDYGPRSLLDEPNDDSDASESMDQYDGYANAMAQGLGADAEAMDVHESMYASDGDGDAMAQGLGARVEPMMESTSVQMLLD